ncbi:hypothetical protein BBP40_000581 [Aspergillus hancockii]|nr:hypothetical protein BBP40_000581 [Aspergillus hancockii]
MEPLDQLPMISGQQPGWGTEFEILSPGSTISALTVDMEEILFLYLPVVIEALRIQGSLPTARRAQLEMLQFAAHPSVKPIMMTLTLNQSRIQEAMETPQLGGNEVESDSRS